MTRFAAFFAAVLLVVPGIAAEPSSTVQSIVAEGAGTTADEALKDAFRNAVRQVVGAVVDAETLIKNDELIDDKVLTYSDGFITNYEEVSGSKKVQGGLHRIKIKADVERRSVVAKLKAANVTVKEVDGGGLFAEIVTDLDAQKNAAALVEKALADFPLNCMKVEVVGKPEIVEKSDDKATIRVLLRYIADLAAYDAFAKRLHDTLKHVAKESGDFSMLASPKDMRGFSRPEWQADIARNTVLAEINESSRQSVGSIAALYEKSPPFVLAVNTTRTKSFERTGWQYYVLDDTARRPLAALASCAFTVKVSLLDSNDETISFDTFLAVNSDSMVVNHATFVTSNLTAMHNAGVTPSLVYAPQPFSEKAFARLTTPPQDFDVAGNPSTRPMRFALIAPFVVTAVKSAHYDRDYWPVEYVATYTQSRDITLSLEELRSVASIKAELSFKGGTLPPKVDQKK